MMSDCPTKDLVFADNRAVLATHKINDAYEFEHEGKTDFCTLETYALNCFGEIVLGLRIMVEVGAEPAPIYFIHPGNKIVKLQKLT